MAYPSMSVVSVALLFLFLFQNIHATQKRDGLSLKMIYWDSPESPLYRANLTDEDRMHDLVQRSHARIKSLAKNYVANKNNSSRSLPSDYKFRPQINAQGFSYMVKLGFGTFETVPSFKTNYLILDTGSDLTWIQCEGCEPNCFSQVDPYFPRSQSRSYKPLPCPTCPPEAECVSGTCIFIRDYAEGSSLKAVASTETVTFDSEGGTILPVANLLFGCGIEQRDFSMGAFPNNRITGIMGLSYGDISFASLFLRFGLTDGKFSYCLQPMHRHGPAPMLLRFGSDVIQKPGMKSTPLPRKPHPQADPEHFYLNLQGITVYGHRLPIPAEAFRIRPDGKGGSIIDSGCASTFLVPEAYRPLEAAITSFIEKHNQNVRRMTPETAPYKICYERYRDPVSITFPEVIFHFENADFHIPPTSTFFIGQTKAGKGMICLMFLESDDSDRLNVLGVYHQTNSRIIYDLKNSQLLFGPDDCSNGN